MKLIITMLLLASISAFPKEPNKKILEVSEVKSDKTDLNIAFKRIQSLELRKKYASGSFYVLQVIDKKSCLIHTKIYNHANGYKEIEILRHITFYLETTEPHNLTDGSFLDQIWYSVSDETKSYINPLGVKKTVKVFKEAIPKEISQKEFVARLKAGETWTFTHYSKQRCDTCRGEGKIRPKKRKIGVEFKRCPECRSKGSVTSPQKWTVKW